MTTESDQIALEVGRRMFAADRVSQALGMRVAAIGPGWADITMPVREDMLNGLGTCHGGILFTLADSAFAYGCNAYNKVSVAHSCEITFLIPGRLGDVLMAKCREQTLIGRSGVYDVEIRNQNDETVALFRGKSRRIRGDVVDGLTPPNDAPKE